MQTEPVGILNRPEGSKQRVCRNGIPVAREDCTMNKHLTLFTTSPPISLTWDEAPDEPIKAPKPIFDNPSLASTDRMVCAQCGDDITRSSQRIAVNGSHRHAVPTAHGIDQEIGCFSLAPGCLSMGHFALDFGQPTEGFWQMAVCAGCGNHLGWHHQTDDAFGFYGLILDHLAAAPDDAKEEAA